MKNYLQISVMLLILSTIGELYRVNLNVDLIIDTLCIRACVLLNVRECVLLCPFICSILVGNGSIGYRNVKS